MLSYRNDLIDKIKPFFEKLHNNNKNEQYNINQEKHIPFLKSLAKFQIKLLKEYEIIDDWIYLAIPSIESADREFDESDESDDGEIERYTRVQEIIKRDNLEEMQNLIREKGIKGISPIIKSFNEVNELAIPIINECIIQKAIKCFKYLLINGIEDPTITNQEYNPYPMGYYKERIWRNEHRYEWDCMGMAIFYGETEIIKILEENSIEKGNNQIHVEAAILSYRNEIVKEIFKQLKENNQTMDEAILMRDIIASTRNSNIKGFELLINNGANINAKDLIYQTIGILYLIKIIENKWRKYNNLNRTPLHYAIKNNSKEILEVLISKGADVNEKDIIYQIIMLLFLIKII